MTRTKHLFATVLIAFICGIAHAEDINYIGAEGGSFFTPTNWSTGYVPGEEATVIIDNAAELLFDDAGANYEISELRIGNTQTTTGNLHRFKMNSGTLYVLSGGVATCVGSAAGWNAEGAMTMNGGEFNTYHCVVGSNARGVLYVNGGVMNISWSLCIGGDPFGSALQPGVVFLNGGVVNAGQVKMYDLTSSIIISDGVLNTNNNKADTLNYIAKGLIAPASGYKLVVCDRNWQQGVRVYAEKLQPSQMFTPGYSFSSSSKIVSTVVFSWYDWPDQITRGWQRSGPWLPLEGEESWTGKPDWWREQIKQIMAANIDYVWMQNWCDNPLANFFGTLYQMRMEGYDVPKMAPFFDTQICYGGYSVDLSTAAGKDDFVSYYIRMYDYYYLANPDANADNFIAQINNKPILAMYSIPGNVLNLASLSRSDVESRLIAAFGAKHPIFNNGVYMIREYSSGVSWADEKVKQFCGEPLLHSTIYNGVKSTRIQPGYWDQNVRSPGLFLARNGGLTYKNNWDTILADSTINHVNVESFNEYDEGSGIYAVDVVNSPRRYNYANNDTWSTTNDPLEYIKTTAVKAAQFNSKAAKDAKIIWHNIPATMKKGQAVPVTVVVRNEGDESWTGAAGYAIAEKAGTNFFMPGSIAINDANDQINFFGGIFRGRPVKFNFILTVPQIAGTYTVHLQMKQGSAYFGEDKAITINVNCSLADFSGDCAVSWPDLKIFADNWLEGN